MNRTIKFRGKRIDNGAWVYGSLFNWYRRKAVIPIIGDGVRNGSIIGNEVDPETVGQFTGLLDKNGREIWEDDVVKDRKGNVDTVNYDSITFNKCIAYASSPQGLCTGFFDNNPIDGIEVIGNIHDTPELLNEK